MTLTTALILLVLLSVIWRFGPRRRNEPGFKFVYVNQDGSVRELSPGEQVYLSTEFYGGDSARPTIKSHYRSRTFIVRSQSGFIKRNRVPSKIKILPVHPDYDARVIELGYDVHNLLRTSDYLRKKNQHDSLCASGYIFKKNVDGSSSYIPNPNISRKKRVELMRNYELARKRQPEQLARVLETDSKGVGKI